MSIGARRLAASLAAATGLLLVAAQVQAQVPGTPTPGGWAIVTADGRLGPNTNVTNVIHVKSGVYRVVFNQTVAHCAATATIAAHGGKTITPGYILVGRTRPAPNELRVYTFLTTTQIPADYKFDILATC